MTMFRSFECLGSTPGRPGLEYPTRMVKLGTRVDIECNSAVLHALRHDKKP